MVLPLAQKGNVFAVIGGQIDPMLLDHMLLQCEPRVTDAFGANPALVQDLLADQRLCSELFDVLDHCQFMFLPQVSSVAGPEGS